MRCRLALYNADNQEAICLVGGASPLLQMLSDGRVSAKVFPELKINRTNYTGSQIQTEPCRFGTGLRVL